MASWFKYGETYLGQGKEKARNFLIENTDIAEEIKQQVLAAGGFMVAGDDSEAAGLDTAEHDEAVAAEVANS